MMSLEVKRKRLRMMTWETGVQYEYNHGKNKQPNLVLGNGCLPALISFIGDQERS